MRAAYCASNGPTDDKDDDDDDRYHPPSRAVPRGLLRDVITVLELALLARKANGSGAVAIRGSGLHLLRRGRSAVAAFIQQIDVVALLYNPTAKDV
jgi:hypothetical protein